MSQPHITLQWLRGYGILTQHRPLSLHSERCTLADVLGHHEQPNSRSFPLSPQDQEQAALCHIASDVSNHYRQWSVHNHSPLLRCTVGGHIVAKGTQTLLEDGDLIEFGLFMVEFRKLPDVLPLAAPQVDAVPATADGASAPASQPEVPAPQRPDIDPYFQLTDLASSQHSGVQLPPADRVHQRASEVAASLDPRAHLAADATTATATADPTHPADPLAALHERYLRVINDPSAAVYMDAFAEQSAASADTSKAWDEMLDRAESGILHLHDAVTPQASFQRVSDGLDTLLGSDIMRDPVFENVLMLFAPPQNQPRSDPSIMPSHRLPTHPLPSITRQEHHGIAIGSYFDLPTQAPPALQESPPL